MSKYKFRIWVYGRNNKGKKYNYPTSLVYNTLTEAEENIPYDLQERPSTRLFDEEGCLYVRLFSICMESEDRSKIYLINTRRKSCFANDSLDFVVCKKCLTNKEHWDDLCNGCQCGVYSDVSEYSGYKNKEIIDIRNFQEERVYFI